jgi:hypothetical protein
LTTNLMRYAEEENRTGLADGNPIKKEKCVIPETAARTNHEETACDTLRTINSTDM